MRLLAGIVAAVLAVAIVFAVGCANPNEANSLEEARVGDTIHLGEVNFIAHYGGEFKDDIAWRVLAVEDDRVLVIAASIIEFRPYNTKYVDITWDQSTLRHWLNDSFYDGLPTSMRNHALTTPLTNCNNPSRGTPGGSDTEDKVFLLSLDEAQEYFTSDKDRQAGIGLSAETIKIINERYRIDLEKDARKRGGGFWWLRSPGYFAYFAAVVTTEGGVGSDGLDVDMGYGVRPALWLSLH